MADRYRLYYAPYHKGTLLLLMTDWEAADRVARIIESKPEREIWTRLETFQPVLRPDLLPEPVQRAYAEWQRAYAEWQRAYAEFQRAYAEFRRADAEFQRAYAEWRRTNAEFQRAVTDHWDAIDARRHTEYPGCAPYERERGLILPDGLPCAET